MSTISISRIELPRFTHYESRRYCQRFRRISPSWTMTMESKSSDTKKKDELSIQLSRPSIPRVEKLEQPDLKFDRLQPAEQETSQTNRSVFGNFVARDAVLDEEYWTAAWLRAESHWEERMSERYVDNYKRKFAEQEYNAIKRRCKGLHGQKCFCIVTVKKEDRNIKRTVIKSVVGTLDLSIRYFLHGENFPGERITSHFFCCLNRNRPNTYGYIANLCVAKSARRQGIASNMLRFAIDTARSSGVEQVYVHVYRNNPGAQDLYQKTGFEIVETAQSVEDDMYLLRLTT